LPSGTGTVLVRVIDTDASRDSSAATLSVDQMFFRRAGAPAPREVVSQSVPNDAESDRVSVAGPTMTGNGPSARWALLADACMTDDDLFWDWW
jgi:hypothetical protein